MYQHSHYSHLCIRHNVPCSHLCIQRHIHLCIDPDIHLYTDLDIHLYIFQYKCYCMWNYNFRNMLYHRMPHGMRYHMTNMTLMVSKTPGYLDSIHFLMKNPYVQSN